MSVYDNALRALPYPLRAKGRSPLQPGARRGRRLAEAPSADSLKPSLLPGRSLLKLPSTRRWPVHDPPRLRRTGAAKRLRRHLGTAADLPQNSLKSAASRWNGQGQDARCMSHDMHLILFR